MEISCQEKKIQTQETGSRTPYQSACAGYIVIKSISTEIQVLFFVKINLAKVSGNTNFEIADSFFGNRIIASAGT